MNREETKQKLIELGITPEMLEGDVWDLRCVDLRNETLSGFILYNADLSGANLSGANLTVANLSRANLSDAVLTVANLSRVNLTGANLTGADLRGADLSDANLSGADLSNANLTDVDLSGAIGPFTTGSFGRHTAIAAGDYIVIGCERHTYEYWLEHYEKIGCDNGYSGDEIADYGAWIRMAVARQRRIEGER